MHKMLACAAAILTIGGRVMVLLKKNVRQNGKCLPDTVRAGLCLVIVILSACSTTGYISIRDPSSEVARRNYAGPGARYYSFLTQPPFCIEGARSGWQLSENLPRQRQRGGFDLYAHNPFSVWIEFFNMSDTDVRSGRWDRHDDFTSPVRDVAVLTFPQPGQTDPNAEDTALLGGSLVDLPVQQPMPPIPACKRLDQSEEGGSTSQIIGAMGYNSGLCSARVAFQTGNPDAPGMLEDIVARFWQEFSTHAHFDNPIQKFTKAVGVLVQPLETVQWQIDETGVEPFAAFILTFHYSVDVLSVGRDVWGSYQYTFKLDPEGVLTLEPLEIRLASSWQDPDSGPLSVISGVRDGLTNTLPQKFREAALSRQAFFPVPTIPCSGVSDCQAFVGPVSALITPEAAMKTWSINVPPSALNTLKCAVGDDAACDANGLVRRFSQVWACIPPPSTATNATPESSCALQLRAFRLVPHQDEVELAWFNDYVYADWFNSAFALSIAANDSQRTQLCNAPPMSPPGTNFPPRRTIPFVSQP